MGNGYGVRFVEEGRVRSSQYACRKFMKFDVQIYSLLSTTELSLILTVLCEPPLTVSQWPSG